MRLLTFSTASHPFSIMDDQPPQRAAPTDFKNTISRAGFDVATDRHLQTDAHHKEGTASRAGGEESCKPDLPVWGNYWWSHSRRAHHRPLSAIFLLISSRINSPGKKKLGLHMEKEFPDFF